MVRNSVQQLALRQQLVGAGRRALREPAASAPGSHRGSQADLLSRPLVRADLSDRCAALELELGKLEQLLAGSSCLNCSIALRLRVSLLVLAY